MPIQTVTNLDYLIDILRLQLGDTNSATYRYTDEWLRTSLVAAVKQSQRWLLNKYLLDANYNVYRNTNVQFEFAEPPIILDKDERIIILLASITIKQGSLENSAWDISSWSDAEIRYTNIDSGKLRNESIMRDLEELKSLVKEPVKRLAWALGVPLPGYKDNSYERSTKY